MRHNKYVQDLEKKASKIYNIKALQQQSQNLGMIFKINNQVRLEQSTELQPNNNLSSIFFLSNVPPRYTSHLKEQIYNKQQVKILENLNRLLQLITK